MLIFLKNIDFNEKSSNLQKIFLKNIIFFLYYFLTIIYLPVHARELLRRSQESPCRWNKWIRMDRPLYHFDVISVWNMELQSLLITTILFFLFKLFNSPWKIIKKSDGIFGHSLTNEFKGVLLSSIESNYLFIHSKCLFDFYIDEQTTLTVIIHKLSFVQIIFSCIRRKNKQSSTIRKVHCLNPNFITFMCHSILIKQLKNLLKSQKTFDKAGNWLKCSHLLAFFLCEGFLSVNLWIRRSLPLFERNVCRLFSDFMNSLSLAFSLRNILIFILLMLMSRIILS